MIHSVGYAMQQLGMKLLNDITWEKPNPAAEPVVSLLHALGRDDYLGRTGRAGKASLRLRADEGGEQGAGR